METISTDCSSLYELGIGGIICLLVLKEVFAFLSKYKDKKNGVGGDYAKMAQQIRDLHLWHAREDDEGVKVWYTRKSWEEAVNRLSDILDKQSEILRELVLEMKTVHRKLDKQPTL